MTEERVLPFDVVVVFSTSRFSRNMAESALYKAMLRKQGVTVQSVTEPIPEGEGDIAELMAQIAEKLLEFNANMTSLQIAKSTHEGQLRTTEKGFHGGGQAPYGYERVRVEDPDGNLDRDGNVKQYTTFEVIPEEAEVVRRIFRLYVQEAKSYRAIAHKFNEEGIQSPGGTTWAPSAVRTILFNENYTGCRVWNQTRRNKRKNRRTKVPKESNEWVRTPDAHERIVDQEMWEAVRKMAERRKEEREHAQKDDDRMTRSVYMLTGLLKCKECGANYVMSTRKNRGKVYRYYRCSSNANRGTCQNRRMVSMLRVERGVLNILSKRLMTKKMIDTVLREIENHTNRDHYSEADDPVSIDLRKRQKKVRKQSEHLTQAIMEGGQIQALVKQLAVCEARERALDTELAKRQKSLRPVALDKEITAEDIKKAIQGLGDALAGAEPHEKKELVNQQVKEIRIPREGDAVLVTEPDGLAYLLGVHKNGDPEGSRTPVS